MTDYTHTVVVDRPVRDVYNQWTQFESFPRFMEGVSEVRQIDDTHTAWDVEIAGVERHFDATITEQRPDEIVAWRTTDGSMHGGRVTFQPADRAGTEVTLSMDFEPEGFVENTNAGASGWRGEVAGGQVADDPRTPDDFLRPYGSE